MTTATSNIQSWPDSQRRKLQRLHRLWRTCENCSLHTTRTHCCPFRLSKYEAGQIFRHPVLLFVGEAPGKDEDNTGIPFIGRSGELLNDMIGFAFQRTQGFSYIITNTIACVPWIEGCEGDRLGKPSNSEQEACLPWLTKLAQLTQPTHVVLVGKEVAGNSSFAKLQLLPSIVIKHPAYFLRQGSRGWKEASMAIVQFVRQWEKEK